MTQGNTILKNIKEFLKPAAVARGVEVWHHMKEMDQEKKIHEKAIKRVLDTLDSKNQQVTDIS